MNQLIFSATIFYLAFGLCCEARSKETDWLDDLITYIKNDNREYQILLVFTDTNKSAFAENIIQRISKNIPVLEISLKDISTISNKTLITNFRTSMVLIFHLSEVMDQLYQAFEILTKHSGSKVRPRCLICASRKQAQVSYKQFLIHTWKKRFLDTTIVEFSELTKTKHLIRNNPVAKLSSIVSYNPFTKTYSQYNYSNLFSWFPEKTRDLHGYNLKVGLIEVPPFVHLERDNNSELSKVYGSDIPLTKTLAELMHFNISWVAPTEESAWGSSLACTKENSTGLLYKLMHNELDFMGFENGRYSACYEDFYEHSKSTKFAKVSIAVPIFRAQAHVTFNSYNLINIAVFIVLFIFTWAISYYILYKPPSLNILQVGRILLGTTAPNEPEKPAERIVFAAILISCMLQASFIYTLIAENSLKLDLKPELENISDVIYSDILPVMGRDYYNAFNENAEDDAKELLKKANTTLDAETCFSQLPTMKNVACAIRSEVAEAKVQDIIDNCGRPVIKVLNDPLRFTTSGMNMEAGSPLVRIFDKLIERLIESGFVAKWQTEKFNRSLTVINPNVTCSDSYLSEEIDIKSQIIYIFTVGYICATVAFLAEIFYAKYFDN